MLNHDTLQLEKRCQKLIDAFKDQLSWKWDERFETVLAEFSVNDKESVSKTIKTQMSNIWAEHNCTDAPETIKTIINYFGGLNPGQQLFTSNLDKNDLILCAWWPWGNGENISIRLGVFSDSLTDKDNEKLMQIFKNWFGL